MRAVRRLGLEHLHLLGALRRLALICAVIIRFSFIIIGLIIDVSALPCV